jgi:hypothetical protein
MTFWVAGAVVGSAVIGGLSSRSAAKTQAGAAESAADAQLQASREANALQQRIYEENVARQKPFLDTGTEFFNRLAALQRGGPGAAQQFLQMDPGYQFRLSEGMKALDRQAAARGGLISGGALKAAQRYGQDLGSQEYSAAYGRLAGLADVGPRAAGVMSGLGERYGQTAGQNLMAGGQAAAQGMLGAGAARASGYMGTANALTGALGTGLNYYQNQQMMNRLFPSGVGGGSPVVSTPYDYGVDQQFSDVRLKTNIVKVGTRDDGLNVYEFNYVWGGPRRVGLMAQEVQNVYPDAVAEVDGYLTVDYGKV